MDLTKFNDEYFKRPVAKKSTGTEEEFFEEKEKKNVIAPERIADQKVVDDKLKEAIKKVDMLTHYLNARFTLTSGQYPHELKF